MSTEKTTTQEPPSAVTIRRLRSASYEKPLFEDSLRDSSGGPRKRRTWTTLLSFILEFFLLAFLLLLPLLFTDVLPKQQLLTFLQAPPPPPPPPPAPAPAPKVVKVSSNIVNGQLRTPSRIPAKVQIVKEDQSPPPVAGGVIGGVPGGVPGGQLDGVVGGILSSTPAAVPALSRPVGVQRVRLSQGVTKGLLISRVEPTYPPLARQARIQGVVVLTAIIDKAGNVQRLQLVSGHPLLASAAIDAVKKWRYKPFLLNGQPVEIETTITVTFQVHNE